MDLNSAIFETSEFKITIQRYGEGWFLQVMTGNAGAMHVESKDFDKYVQAVEYASDKYDLGLFRRY